jgi:hypothetical protein
MHLDHRGYRDAMWRAIGQEDVRDEKVFRSHFKQFQHAPGSRAIDRRRILDSLATSYTHSQA